jgi:hypothetical protein
MVCIRTSEFTIDVPESSMGRAGASHPVPRGTATCAAHEHRVAASHAERAHVGANREHGATRRAPAAPPAGARLILH